MRSMCVGSASILIYLGRMNAVYEWGATVKTNLRRRALPGILQNRPRTGKCEDARTNEEIAPEGCAVDLPRSPAPGLSGRVFGGVTVPSRKARQCLHRPHTREYDPPDSMATILQARDARREGLQRDPLTPRR